MTEEEKKEFEEFLEWKRAKQAAQEINTPEQSEQAELSVIETAESTTGQYVKEERSVTPPPPPVTPEIPTPKKSGCGKIILIVLAAFFGLMILGNIANMCTSNPPVEASSSDDDSTAMDSAAADITAGEESKPSTQWVYSEETDEMSDQKAYFATVLSTNSEEFDFPYQGGARLMLTVRKSPKFGNDVLIRISKGQFHSSIRGTNIKVRFDDEPQYNVYCNEASDGSSDVLFLSGYSSLVGKLKTHKTMKINAEFFQEGNRTFTFDISNLEWDH